MPRLISGEFSSRVEAHRAMAELMREGIPHEEIRFERELPARGFYRKHREVQTATETERRNVGMITGMLIGALGGAVSGFLALTVDYVYATLATPAQPTAAPWWVAAGVVYMIACGLIGTLLGGMFGYTLDTTLTRLGAGPGDPNAECLVTVWAKESEAEVAETVLAGARARHVLVTE